MKLDIKQNAKKGMKFGFLYRLIATVMSFLVQTVFIRQLGIDYAGLKGLFSSILTVFSLAELGFGSAIVFSMYRPIAEENESELCALLNLYKKIYRIIGIVIFVLSIAIIPFLSRLVKGEYPLDINIHVVFLLFVIQTVLSYWMFSYKTSLLQAYQRNDVINLIGLIITFATSVSQIILLVFFKSIYAYLIVAIIFVVINNLAINIITERLYPDIHCSGMIKPALLREIKKRVLGVFIGKVCDTTRNTFDSIFISSFIGLSQTGIYTNYFYILTALNTFTSVISSSLLAGVGNRIILESKKRNFEDMMKINKMYLILSGWISVCMLCLYQPFMTLWIGNNYLFPNYVMVLFPIYFYIQKMGDVRGIYSDAAGLFWENRWRTIAETVANLILNFALVKLLGVFGILLATIINLFFIGFLGSTQVIFKYYFDDGKREYLFNEAKYLLITVFVGLVTYVISEYISVSNLWALLGIRIVLCLTVVPVLYACIFWYGNDYYEIKGCIDKVVKR